MVNWFWRRNTRAEVPQLKPRSEEIGATKVDLADLTPAPLSFLGQAAYVQLTLFENLSRTIATAPTTDAKEALSLAASLSLTKHHGLTAEIQRLKGVPASVMDPYTSGVDTFQRLTQGADWYENLMTCHITAAILDDFFARLGEGLPRGIAATIAEVYRGESGQDLIATELRHGIAANPRLAARLALWGRRLVGDTMLVARGALAPSAISTSDEARIEPVFTELIAAHTRRMDALGLTA